MEALDALVTRVSPVRLAQQEVDDTALARILEAGLRAADHGRLRPWKFLVARGEARARLGEVMAEALRRRNAAANAASLEAERQKPLRAPLIVVVAAALRAGAKIPVIEQVASAAAAAQNMLVAAHALGLGGFWRTGAPAYDAYVKSELGLSPDDQIVALLYIGYVSAPGTPKAPDPAGVVEEWRGPATAAP
jgi:nitroreductase